MAKHYNPTISEDARRIFNTKTGDMLGTEVGSLIVPTIELKRKCNIVRRNSTTNAASAVVYTTPTDKDFYLVGFNISFAKDVAATSESSYLVVTLDDGLSVIIGMLKGVTSTASRGDMSFNTYFPIQLKRGTPITLTNDNNVSEIRSVATIYGYTVETTN